MEDYKERLCKEYFDLTTRIMGLQNVLYHNENGTLDFKLVSPVELMRSQLRAMKDYRDCLETRARLENIPL